MSLYDFGSEFAQTFKEKCTCGRLVKVSTQKDNHPEYRTEIYVQCLCGKSVEFSLPVN